MFQVNFSNRAIAELNKLGKLEQLEIMEALGGVTPKRLTEDGADLGRFGRDGRTLYRLRVDDWRIYFEAEGDRLTVVLILHCVYWHVLRHHLVRGARTHREIQRLQLFSEILRLCD